MKTLKELMKPKSSGKTDSAKATSVPSIGELKEFVEKLYKDSKALVEVLTPFASLLYSIYKWAKESNIDGEITEEEFKEVLKLIKEFVDAELKQAK